jgi:hypothetical protein
VRLADDERMRWIGNLVGVPFAFAFAWYVLASSGSAGGWWIPVVCCAGAGLVVGYRANWNVGLGAALLVPLWGVVVLTLIIFVAALTGGND